MPAMLPDHSEDQEIDPIDHGRALQLDRFFTHGGCPRDGFRGMYVIAIPDKQFADSSARPSGQKLRQFFVIFRELQPIFLVGLFAEASGDLAQVLSSCAASRRNNPSKSSIANIPKLNSHTNLKAGGPMMSDD